MYKYIYVCSTLQGSSIYSETAAKNYGSWDVFGLQVLRIPAKRLGTTEEVCTEEVRRYCKPAYGTLPKSFLAISVLGIRYCLFPTLSGSFVHNWRDG